MPKDEGGGKQGGQYASLLSQGGRLGKTMVQQRCGGFWREGRGLRAALLHHLLPGEPKRLSLTNKHGILRLSPSNTPQLQPWVHPILDLTG